MDYRAFEAQFPLASAGLLNARRQGRLGGSYLIYGDDPAQREAGACYLAALASCPSPRPDGSPCGSCRVCKQLANHGYAELYELSPSGKAGQIRIGDEDDPEPNTLRWFVRQFELASSAGDGRKIGVIHQADAMNAEAQNAFLKTLEEPNPGVLFLLLSGNPSALLATTRSRCQLLPLLTNSMRYDFAGHEELAKLLAELLWLAGEDVTAASRIADDLIELAGNLAADSEARADEAWAARLEQAESSEDRSLAKRVTEQRDNAAASWYLALRKQFLSLIDAFCTEAWMVSVTGSRENLPNPELLEGMNVPGEMDQARMLRARNEAAKLLYRLRFQVDEKLALRAFALNTACGE